MSPCLFHGKFFWCFFNLSLSNFFFFLMNNVVKRIEEILTRFKNKNKKRKNIQMNNLFIYSFIQVSHPKQDLR